MDVPTPAGEPDAHDGARRILIVDDDPDLRQMLGEVISDQGWAVAEARHGEHALDRLKAERFAVVLLDHRMPGLLGSEVYTRLRAAGDETTVTLITAARDGREIELSLGTPPFLAKPFDLDELIAMIKANASACT